MEFQYYIHEDTFTTNKQGLKTGTTISKVPSVYTIKYVEDGDEGPFKDLPSLRKESKIFRKLLTTNPKRAQQICQEKHINVMKDFVLTDENVSVSPDFVELIEHCTKGKIRNGRITGIHFYDRELVKIRKVLKKNKKGVFEAKIEYYDSEMDRWTKKEKPSTFFPPTWTLNKLFHECLFAVNNKKKKFGALNVYKSKMESGINVEIIIKDGLLKSIYPLL
ncbi:Conserved hypothetical protein [Zobellia galactanivorans]|uniref:Bacterial EndoU nuclease domain-containing protein n=1 Tax=Zobellia galactanivorans (strain DSM 12802 / CCUG 47099 / CIP 106680 / NCIMB 13871 / Dsij) TaxID=63186 RepID=G0L7D8_ZOBGA|nr:Conserved hypothetical protein [Zobellia galactanivorans]